MVKKYKKTKIKKPKGYDKAIRNSIPLGDLLSGKTSMKGMLIPIMGTGKRAMIIDTTPKGGYGTGHMPKAKFAGLSDGSKLVLSGPNKGKII